MTSSTMQSLAYPLGTCVDVKGIGTGVIVDYRDDIDAYVARFGGLRGELGSELRKVDDSSIIGPVTAAVGLPVLTPGGIGKVLARNPDDSYVVNLEGAVAGRTTATYAPRALSCRIAKVMPLVERVAEHGQKKRQEVSEGADVSDQVEDIINRLERLEELMESATESTAATLEQKKEPLLVPEIEKGAKELRMSRAELESVVSEREATFDAKYSLLHSLLERAFDHLWVTSQREESGGITSETAGERAIGKEERRDAFQLLQHLLTVEEYERPRRRAAGEERPLGGGETPSGTVALTEPTPAERAAAGATPAEPTKTAPAPPLKPGSILERAKQTVAPAVEKVKGTVYPAVEKARETVRPAVDRAQETVQPPFERAKEAVVGRSTEAERESGAETETESVRHEVLRTELQMQTPLLNNMTRLRKLGEASNDADFWRLTEEAGQVTDQLIRAQADLSRANVAWTLRRWRDELYDNLGEILKRADEQAKEEGGGVSAKAVAAAKIAHEKIGGTEGAAEKVKEAARKIQETAEVHAPEVTAHVCAIGGQSKDIGGKAAEQAKGQALGLKEQAEKRYPEAHEKGAAALEEAGRRAQETREQPTSIMEEDKEAARRRADEVREQAPGGDEARAKLDHVAEDARRRATDHAEQYPEAEQKAQRLLEKARERVAERAEREDWRGTARQKAREVEAEVQEMLPGILRQVTAGERRARDVLRMLKGEDVGGAMSRRTEAQALRFLENWVLAWLATTPHGDSEDTILPKGLKETAEGRPLSAGVSAAPGLRRRATLYDVYSAGDLIGLYESGELADELAKSLLRTALKRTYEALTVVAGQQPGDIDIGGRGYRPAAAAALTLRELLTGVAGRGMSMEQAVEKAQSFLSTDEGAALASDILSGARERAQGLAGQAQETAEVGTGGVSEIFADPRVKERMRRQYEEMDTELMWQLTQSSVKDDDAEARRRLMQLLADEVARFMRDTLPHIRLPPVAGKTNKNISYTISNLSMKQFKMSEAGVKIEVADMLRLADAVTKDEEVRLEGTEGVTPPTTKVERELQTTPSTTEATGVAGEDATKTRLHAEILPMGVAMGRPESSPDVSEEEGEFEHTEEPAELTEEGLEGGPAIPEEAREELFRALSEIDAQFSGVGWSFRQEAFPWTFGNGTAVIKMRGAVRIGFALRTGTLHPESDVEAPLLIMSSREVFVDKLKLKAADSALAPMLNLFIKAGKKRIKHQVVQAMRQQIDANASAFLGRLNCLGAQAWPLLATGTTLDLSRLPKATKRQLKIARGDFAPGTVARDGQVAVDRLGKFDPGSLGSEEITVSFADEGPIGVAIAEVEAKFKQTRTVIVGLDQNAQEERLLGEQGVKLLGAEIVAVADEDTRGKSAEELRDMLRRVRPIKVTFRTYVPRKPLAATVAPPGLRVVRVITQDLGVKFRASRSLGQLVTEVCGYTEPRLPGQPSLSIVEAEMPVGALLYSINGEITLGVDFLQVAKMLKRLGRPVEFGLLPNPDREMHIMAPPPDVRFAERVGKYMVSSLKFVPSPHEGNPKIEIGDVLAAVNDQEVIGSKADTVQDPVALLADPRAYPMTLRLMHQSPGMELPTPGEKEGLIEKVKHRMKSYEVKIASLEELGMRFEVDAEGRAILKELMAIPGPTWRGSFLRPGTELVAVNGRPATAASLMKGVSYPATFTFRDPARFAPIEPFLKAGRVNLGPAPPDTNPVEAMGDTIIQALRTTKEKLPQAKEVVGEQAESLTSGGGGPAGADVNKAGPMAGMAFGQEQPVRPQEMVG